MKMMNGKVLQWEQEESRGGGPTRLTTVRTACDEFWKKRGVGNARAAAGMRGVMAREIGRQQRRAAGN
jgi:hypothetical protein